MAADDARRRPLRLLVNPASGGKPAAPVSDAPPLEPEEMVERLAARGLDVSLHLLEVDDFSLDLVSTLGRASGAPAQAFQADQNVIRLTMEF